MDKLLEYKKFEKAFDEAWLENFINIMNANNVTKKLEINVWQTDCNDSYHLFAYETFKQTSNIEETNLYADIMFKEDNFTLTLQDKLIEELGEPYDNKDCRNVYWRIELGVKSSVGNKILPCAKEFASWFINLDSSLMIKKYVWTAKSNDGSYEDQSVGYFENKKRCYLDMRNAVLEKVKWNTEYEDFEGNDNEENFNDQFIKYGIEFYPNKIIHKSYSGVYTYEMKEKFV